MQEIQKNDDFTKLFAKSHGHLYNFAFSLTMNRSDADDIMQEAMVLIWERFEEYDSDKPFTKWAMAFIYRKVLENRRKHARRAKILSSEALKIIYEEQLEAVEIERPLYKVLDECLAKISDYDRELIAWRYSPSFSLKGLAEKYNRSVNAISKRLQKIRYNVAVCVKNNIKAESK